jgi:hypothetical protein
MKNKNLQFKRYDLCKNVMACDWLLICVGIRKTAIKNPGNEPYIYIPLKIKTTSEN